MNFFRWFGMSAVLLAAPLLFAAPVSSGEEGSKSQSTAEKTRKALNQTRDLDIGEQPLAVAIKQLSEQTNIKFVVDHNVILGIGIDPNSANVSIKQKNVKVRTAVRNMLHQLNLTCVVLGDTVVITTEEMAVQRQLKQPVSLDLDGITVSAALKQLSRETASNLLLDPKLKKESDKTVILQLEDVPLDTALRLICESAGLKPVRLGNVIYVTSKECAQEIRSDPELTQAQQQAQEIYKRQQEWRLWQVNPPPVPVPVPPPVPPAPVQPPGGDK
jgi:hypothetical protein